MACARLISYEPEAPASGYPRIIHWSALRVNVAADGATEFASHERVAIGKPQAMSADRGLSELSRKLGLEESGDHTVYCPNSVTRRGGSPMEGMFRSSLASAVPSCWPARVATRQLTPG